MEHKGGGNCVEVGVFVPQVGVEDHPSNRVRVFLVSLNFERERNRMIKNNYRRNE